ncbi:amino acid adenylation domain-containing protein, partial [Paenibacillus oenotherae]
MANYLKQIRYWEKALSEEDAITYIPYDTYSSHSHASEGQFNHHIHEMPENLSERLFAIGNRSHYTIYTLLLAAVHCLLSKYTGNGTVITGMPVISEAIRSGEDSNPIIFLKSKFDATDTFKNVLARMSSQLKEATDNQSLPFHEIAKRIQLSYSSELPMVETIVTLTNIHSEKYQQSIISNMIFLFTIDGSNIDMKIRFNEVCYQEAAIVRLCEHFNQLLEQLLSFADQPLVELEWIGFNEKRMLAAFNGTEAPYPKEQTIHGLFEEQVKRAPERTALVYGEERLSYAELNARSNRLARRLREQGVGPDELVGIALERSTKMIVAILAVLKAGGAYVPIDPSYPEERIRYTLEDAGVKLVLTQTDLAEKLAGITESLLVLERGLLEEGDGTDLPERAGAEHLAYVIYTSGSTGRPKGVLIEHRSLVNLSEWHRQFYRVTEEDVAATYASFAFDASVWELFPYLIAGASVCIVPEEIRLEMKELTEFYREHEITIAWLPPQMYEQLLEEEAPSKLRLLLTGADKVKGYKPVPYEVWNTYGPTESTVICTAYRIEGESGNIPIGKPLSNTRLYVMDDRLREQPIGVAGELCIAGAGLARGYLNRPELTEEKFVQHPNGERLYRTGDLARWLPDGNLDYLGRIDEQVKIRGYRIELGEIEAVLQRHEQVKEAVVIARQDKGADSYLCAYVVGHGKLEAAELRRYVGSQLPSYMVPAFF